MLNDKRKMILIEWKTLMCVCVHFLRMGIRYRNGVRMVVKNQVFRLDLKVKPLLKRLSDKDFFLQNVTLYFTPTTTALCMERSFSTIKDCMNILRRNSYLSKISDDGTVYHITKENMEFWHTDFKKYVLALEEILLTHKENCSQ